jgi:hypothetical protein
MKHYLNSNDPLFDPVTLGYVLHRGAIRDRKKTITSTRDQVLGAANSNWQELLRLIQLNRLNGLSGSVSSGKLMVDTTKRPRNRILMVRLQP